MPRLALIAIGLMMLGCQGPCWRPATDPGPRKVEVMRGSVHELRPGHVTFKPCNVNMHLDVDDRTGRLAAARSKVPRGSPHFVEIRIERGVRSDDWRTESDRRLVVIEVLRSEPVDEATGCGWIPSAPP